MNSLRTYLTILVIGLFIPPLFAQQEDEEETVYDLSPFTISEEETIGYQATTTLAGSRLKTNLRDVGAAVSVVTKEIFDDTGATDGATILSFMANTEVGGPNGNFADVSFSASRPNPSEQQRMPQNSQRVRGLAKASLTRGFFLTDIPFDSYNSDRVTVNRGPNSLLFGIGEPGGVINNAVNGASLGQDFGELSVRVGERGSYRTTVDYNKVLIEDRLALRFSALNENTEYQQRPTYERDERFYLALNLTLFKNEGSDFFDKTVLRGNFEQGEIEGNPPSIIPPAEGISNWFSLPSRSSIESITGSTLPAYWDDGTWSPKLTVNTEWGADFNKVPAPVGDYVTIQMPLVYRNVNAQTPFLFG
ncbi:MAG: TonB-dependent receptor plug domain-containing protein [Opitutales bacterium]|nr:TonB-dependent receptor plug domain-containing protein [Opitutales bacterium]